MFPGWCREFPAKVVLLTRPSLSLDTALSFSFLTFFFPLLSSHVTVFLLYSPLPPFPLSFPYQPPALPHVFSLCLSLSLFISHMNFKPWGAGGLGVSDSETRRETVCVWKSWSVCVCVFSVCMHLNADTSVCSSTCKRVYVCHERNRDSVCYRCIRVPGTVGRVWFAALILKGLP